MPRIYLPPVSSEDKIVLICISAIVVLWLIWSVFSNSRWSDSLKTFQVEEWLWRKHGVTVPGVFFMMFIMTVVLYIVWLTLGQL